MVSVCYIVVYIMMCFLELHGFIALARHNEVWWWSSGNSNILLFGVPKIHHGKILYRQILLECLHIFTDCCIEVQDEYALLNSVNLCILLFSILWKNYNFDRGVMENRTYSVIACVVVFDALCDGPRVSACTIYHNMVSVSFL